MTKNIYLGGPLFSEMEIAFNIGLETKIKEKFGESVSIYNPCNNGEINDKSNYADSIMIANGDNAYLEEADILVAVLDGQTMDVGLAAEIGYFFSMNKPIIALYSDTRQGNVTEEKTAALDKIAESQWSYINLYVVGLIKQRGVIVGSSDEVLDALTEYL